MTRRSGSNLNHVPRRVRKVEKRASRRPHHPSWISPVRSRSASVPSAMAGFLKDLTLTSCENSQRKTTKTLQVQDQQSDPRSNPLIEHRLPSSSPMAVPICSQSSSPKPAVHSRPTWSWTIPARPPSSFLLAKPKLSRTRWIGNFARFGVRQCCAALVWAGCQCLTSH